MSYYGVLLQNGIMMCSVVLVRKLDQRGSRPIENCREPSSLVGAPATEDFAHTAHYSSYLRQYIFYSFSFSALSVDYKYYPQETCQTAIQTHPKSLLRRGSNKGTRSSLLERLHAGINKMTESQGQTVKQIDSHSGVCRFYLINQV